MAIFDMFNGGGPDPMTLMVLDYEEQKEKEDRRRALEYKDMLLGVDLADDIEETEEED